MRAGERDRERARSSADVEKSPHPAKIRDLGEPYAALWRILVDEHGPKDAARRFARVLGAIVDHGEAFVAERIRAALATGESVLLALHPATALPAAITADALPAALASYEIEAGRAADYDALLGGAS